MGIKIKRNLAGIVVLSFIFMIPAGSMGKTFNENFDKGDINDLKGWEIEGDVKMSADQKHGGTKSLFVPAGAKAVWTLSEENKYGKATFWVFDSLLGAEIGKKSISVMGPRWGVQNVDGDSFVFGLINKESKSVRWGIYFWCSTAMNQWFDWPYPGKGFTRTKGWHKWAFDFSSDKTLEVIMDEDKTANTPIDQAQFTAGFTGLYFYGGKESENNPETFYYDDIQVDMK